MFACCVMVYGSTHLQAFPIDIIGLLFSYPVDCSPVASSAASACREGSAKGYFVTSTAPGLFMKPGFFRWCAPSYGWANACCPNLKPGKMQHLSHTEARNRRASIRGSPGDCMASACSHFLLGSAGFIVACVDKTKPPAQGRAPDQPGVAARGVI